MFPSVISIAILKSIATGGTFTGTTGSLLSSLSHATKSIAANNNDKLILNSLFIVKNFKQISNHLFKP